MVELKNEDKIDEIEDKYIAYLENVVSMENITGNKSIRELVKETGLGFFSSYLKIVEIRPLEDYKLWCHLSTNETKIYDFAPHLDCEMFQHLKDKTKFDCVSVGSWGVPTWISEETGDELDISISWILIDGMDA